MYFVCCAALYARISVQCNQCKLRYQKTSAVARYLVTVFNEVVIFSLPELPLEQCKILVSVYETRKTRKSTKYLIGQLIVGREKTLEDKHWSLMMQSVRQPVAKWHGLLIWVRTPKSSPSCSPWMSVPAVCSAGCWEICICLTAGQTWTHLPPDSTKAERLCFCSNQDNECLSETWGYTVYLLTHITFIYVLSSKSYHIERLFSIRHFIHYVWCRLW